MKLFSLLSKAVRLAGLSCLLLVAARADVASYLVTIDTSAIANTSSAPFSLDLQSLFGDGAAQSIAVSNFSLTGGSFSGGATLIGDVSGSTASSVQLNPSSTSFYNEYFEQFSAGVTSLQFLVSLTTNAADVTPTSFSVALLDSSLLNLATSGVGDTLVLFNLNGSQTNFQIGNGSGVVVSVASIPEPSTYALLAGASALVVAVRRRRTAVVTAA